MISWHGGKYLCLIIVGLGLLFEPQNDPIQNSSEEIIAKLKATTAARRAKDIEVAKARNSLDRRIDSFVVEQCPLYYVIYGIRRLGINVCHEAAEAKVEAYVDPEGVSAFGADRPISVRLARASVREILDHICKEDPRYAWTHDEKRGLVVLAPNEKSQLQFAIGPIKEHGNPYDVLQRISRAANEPPLKPGAIRGGNHLPDIVLDSPRCTAVELLNQIVAQHPGMTWTFGRGFVSISHSPISTAEAVRIEFPNVRKGTPTNGWWHYSIVERKLDGVWTMTVEKQKLKVPIDFTGPLPPPALAAAAAAAAARQRDGRTDEQNVVASRLAGSWKLEPALTERLTGTAKAGEATLLFVVDPEVEKKIPARFIEAVKKQGITLDVRLAGYLEMRGAKFPFIQTTLQGNPLVIYFRERGGDPLGDSESFNVMLAPAKDRKNDLLFVGGDFNNQPFRAYARDDVEK